MLSTDGIMVLYDLPNDKDANSGTDEKNERNRTKDNSHSHQGLSFR